MRSIFIPMTAGIALSLTFAVAPAMADATEDCAARPPANQPGAATMDVDPADPGKQALTEKLTACGSVLDPPKVGDPDIVEPAPHVGDPININPTAPDAKQP